LLFGVTNGVIKFDGYLVRATNYLKTFCWCFRVR